MSKAVFTFLLGGSLSVLPLSAALGNESTADPHDMGWTALTVPAAPHLETLRWLNSGFDFTREPNVDGHVVSKLDDLQPFLATPTIPPRPITASGKISGSHTN